MRIARDGTWYYRGSPINRIPLVKLFASVLRREADGRAHRYTPTTSRAEYGARLMRDALDDAGDPAEALVRFVGQMSAEEAAALRAALRAHKRSGAS